MNYRKIYEDNFGPIPKDQDGRSFDIHHLDKNHFNNSPENLQALSIQEHYDIHYSQGDYGACARMGPRMKITHEEISRLASLAAKKRIDNGMHPFLDKEKARERALKQVADGTHPFQKRKDGTSVASDRVVDGTHPFLSGEIQRKNNLKRVADGTNSFQKRKDGTSISSDRVKDGTHHFLGGEIARKTQQKLVANGTHNFIGGKIGDRKNVV